MPLVNFGTNLLTPYACSGAQRTPHAGSAALVQCPGPPLASREPLQRRGSGPLAYLHEGQVRVLTSLNTGGVRAPMRLHAYPRVSISHIKSVRSQ